MLGLLTMELPMDTWRLPIVDENMQHHAADKLHGVTMALHEPFKGWTRNEQIINNQNELNKLNKLNKQQIKKLNKLNKLNKQMRYISHMS